MWWNFRRCPKAVRDNNRMKKNLKVKKTLKGFSERWLGNKKVFFWHCPMFPNFLKHLLIGLNINARILMKDWVLCFSTSFWVLRARKSWSKHIFQLFFNLFCSFQSFFSDFTAEITKNVWKWTKKRGFVYSSKLVDSLRGYLKIVFFRLIFFHLFKIIEILNKFKIFEDQRIGKFSNIIYLEKLDLLSEKK